MAHVCCHIWRVMYSWFLAEEYIDHDRHVVSAEKWLSLRSKYDQGELTQCKFNGPRQAAVPTTHLSKVIVAKSHDRPIQHEGLPDSESERRLECEICRIDIDRGLTEIKRLS